MGYNNANYTFFTSRLRVSINRFYIITIIICTIWAVAGNTVHITLCYRCTQIFACTPDNNQIRRPYVPFDRWNLHVLHIGRMPWPLVLYALSYGKRNERCSFFFSTALRSTTSICRTWCSPAISMQQVKKKIQTKNNKKTSRRKITRSENSNLRKVNNNKIVIVDNTCSPQLGCFVRIRLALFANILARKCYVSNTFIDATQNVWRSFVYWWASARPLNCLNNGQSISGLIVFIFSTIFLYLNVQKCAMRNWAGVKPHQSSPHFDIVCSRLVVTVHTRSFVLSGSVKCMRGRYKPNRPIRESRTISFFFFVFASHCCCCFILFVFMHWQWEYCTLYSTNDSTPWNLTRVNADRATWLDHHGPTTWSHRQCK